MKESPKFLVDVLVESVGEGDEEGSECCFPALGGVALDEEAEGGAFILGLAGLFGSFAGPFVLDIADDQPQQFHHRIIFGEMAAILDDLPQLIIQ